MTKKQLKRQSELLKLENKQLLQQVIKLEFEIKIENAVVSLEMLELNNQLASSEKTHVYKDNVITYLETRDK